MKQNDFRKFRFWLATMAVVLMGLAAISIAADRPLNVYVVNYPLKYFAERIGGDHVKVTFPVPPSVDPAYWVPDIGTIAAYQQADMILLNGAGYAKWIGKVSLPRSKTVDTARKFKDRLITIKEVTTHSHGAAGKHAHEDLAFTTWLDFSLAVEQARAVTRALIRKRPQFKASFEAGYASLEKDLLDLDRHLKDTVSRSPATSLVVSHPVYDYLTRRYGLNARAVHWEPDQVPTVAQMTELKSILSNHPARWMIWEGEPVQTTVERLTAMGVGSFVFNPCGNVPGSGDFLKVMWTNVTNLRLAYD